MFARHTNIRVVTTSSGCSSASEINATEFYQNPNSAVFAIRSANADVKTIYQTYDTQGSIIHNKFIRTSDTTTEDVFLNLDFCVYFIKLSLKNQSIVEKLVIQ